MSGSVGAIGYDNRPLAPVHQIQQSVTYGGDSGVHYQGPSYRYRGVQRQKVDRGLAPYHIAKGVVKGAVNLVTGLVKAAPWIAAAGAGAVAIFGTAAVIGAVTTAAIVAGPWLALAGAGFGAYKIIKNIGVANEAKKYGQTADYNYAMENIGEGIFDFGLSAIGIGQAVKAVRGAKFIKDAGVVDDIGILRSLGLRSMEVNKPLAPLTAAEQAYVTQFPSIPAKYVPLTEQTYIFKLAGQSLKSQQAARNAAMGVRQLTPAEKSLASNVDDYTNVPNIQTNAISTRIDALRSQQHALGSNSEAAGAIQKQIDGLEKAVTATETAAHKLYKAGRITNNDALRLQQFREARPELISTQNKLNQQLRGFQKADDWNEFTQPFKNWNERHYYTDEKLTGLRELAEQKYWGTSSDSKLAQKLGVKTGPWTANTTSGVVGINAINNTMEALNQPAYYEGFANANHFGPPMQAFA